MQKKFTKNEIMAMLFELGDIYDEYFKKANDKRDLERMTYINDLSLCINKLLLDFSKNG